MTACPSTQVERAFADADDDAKANSTSNIAPPAVATAAATTTASLVPEQAAATPEPAPVPYSPPVTQNLQTGRGNGGDFPGYDLDEHETLELLTPPPPPLADAPSVTAKISRMASSFSESSADEGTRGTVGMSSGDVGFATAVESVAGSQERKPGGSFRNRHGAETEASGDVDGEREEVSLRSRSTEVTEGWANHAARPTELKIADGDDRLSATLPDLRLVVSPAGEEVDAFAATRAAVRARLASRNSVLGSAKRLSTPVGPARWSDDSGVPAGVMASPRYWESASASVRTAFDRETRFLSSQM